MGLCASQARLIFLTSKKNQLEFRVQMICQQRMNNMSMSSAITQAQTMESDHLASVYQNLLLSAGITTPLTGAGADQQPGMIEAAKIDYERRKEEWKIAKESSDSRYQNDLAKINNDDSKLEIMQKQLETQRDAVITEIDSVKKVIQKNIEMTFKYFA